ncbi:MAG: T9SS type A sorting domain-containing protein [Candidatus Hatepunaea meridiana]|nr:T9SS type A sorting domain-containing protein [Candidatus Hatepunaea meridiana]
MKNGFLILLAGLLIVSLLPYNCIAADDQPTMSRAYPVELRGDGEQQKPAGPRRDLGPDWIFYDDGRGQWLLHWGNSPLWSRTQFTPNADFELQAVRFQISNGNDVDETCHVFVYTEDQNNHNLEDLIWEGETDDLPSNEWITLELDEDDFHTFDQGENFSIIYGPAPSGDPNNNGQGWWNSIDSATDVHRSYVAQAPQNNPPSNHANDWHNFDSDLLLRANGEFQDDFIDAGIIGVFNNNEKWVMCPGDEQSITARLSFDGTAPNFIVVSFDIYDSEGNSVWDEPCEIVVEDPFEDDDEIEVECEEVWTAGDEGHYMVEVLAATEEDANDDNDMMFLEQLVYDFEAEEHGYLGFCDEDADGQFSGTEDEGWMVGFQHPGCETSLWVEKFRYFFENGGDQALEVRLGIGVFDPGQRTYEWRGFFTGEIAAETSDWVEIELEDDEKEQTSFADGQEVHIAYFYSPDLSLKADGTPPISGVNADMPSTMFTARDNGQEPWEGTYFAEGGDWMGQVILGTSDVLPEGAWLRIEPDTLDFGHNLATDEDHIIEATFTAYGNVPVVVAGFRFSGAAGDYVTLDPNEEFTIEPEEERTVTVTFRTDEQVDLDSRVMINNDSDNKHNYIWTILASTYPDAVDEANIGTPVDYALSQNFPNPFNPTTTIEYSLKAAGDVKLNVIDMSGRVVNEVVNGRQDAGYHNVEIDASNLPAGIYLYRLTAGDFTSTKKMLLLK